MKQESIRTTVDPPAELYRKFKEQASARGSFVWELVLAGIRVVLRKHQRPQLKNIDYPLIKSKGSSVRVTNEQIYDDVEFP